MKPVVYLFDRLHIYIYHQLRMGFHPVAVAQYNTQGTPTNHKEHITLGSVNTTKWKQNMEKQLRIKVKYAITYHFLSLDMKTS
jgi:hypothetical protein